jgi:hypothetical protein
VTVTFVEGGSGDRGVAVEVQGGTTVWTHWNAVAFHVSFPTRASNAASTDGAFIRSDQVIRIGASRETFAPVGDHAVAWG